MLTGPRVLQILEDGKDLCLMRFITTESLHSLQSFISFSAKESSFTNSQSRVVDRCELFHDRGASLKGVFSVWQSVPEFTVTKSDKGDGISGLVHCLADDVATASNGTVPGAGTDGKVVTSDEEGVAAMSVVGFGRGTVATEAMEVGEVGSPEE